MEKSAFKKNLKTQWAWTGDRGLNKMFLFETCLEFSYLQPTGWLGSGCKNWQHIKHESVGNRELQSALKLHLKMKIELNFTHKKFALKYFKVFPNRFKGKVFN